MEDEEEPTESEEKTDEQELPNSEDMSAPEEDTLRILFLGDSMMDGNVAGAMDQFGMDYPLREFTPLLEKADLIVVNLETAVGTSGELMEDKSFVFQTDPAYLELFEPYKDRVVFTLLIIMEWMRL